MSPILTSSFRVLYRTAIMIAAQLIREVGIWNSIYTKRGFAERTITREGQTANSKSNCRNDRAAVKPYLLTRLLTTSKLIYELQPYL